MFESLKKYVTAATSKLPFSLGSLVDRETGIDGAWELHEGTWIADDSPCSVFVFRCGPAEGGRSRQKSDDRIAAAKSGVRRLRTTKHPNVLRVLDTAETTDNKSTVLYLATERVVPVMRTIRELSAADGGRPPNAQYVSWGLHQVLSAASFLSEDCGLVHGAVGSHSIFVNDSMDWRLGFFDLVTEHKLLGGGSRGSGSYLDPQAMFEILVEGGQIAPQGCPYWPAEVQRSQWGDVAAGPSHGIDAWGVGCLVQELYCGTKLERKEELMNVANIPIELRPDYQKLLSSQPRQRLSLKKCLQNEVFDNKLCRTVIFLEEIGLKDAGDKEAFFKRLPSIIDELPRAFCVAKMLPLLATAMEFGSGSAVSLGAYLKVAGMIEADETRELKVVPVISRLFASTDRTIRVALLQNFSSFARYLSDKVVQEQVFPSLASGFSDASPFLRELTLKSIIPIVPKLKAKVREGDLLRFLSRLQQDEQPPIRTNATICLGKIAVHLSEKTRKKCLAPAFTRAMQDTFPHARGAAVAAVGATLEYFDPSELASSVLPALCFRLVDPSADVRGKALGVVGQCLAKLAENHKVMSGKEAELAERAGSSADASSASGLLDPSGMFNWASDALSKVSITTPTSTPMQKTANPNSRIQGFGRGTNGSPELRKENGGSVDNEGRADGVHNLLDLMGNPATPPREKANNVGSHSIQPFIAQGLGDSALNGWEGGEDLLGIFDEGSPKETINPGLGRWSGSDVDLTETFPAESSPQVAQHRTTSGGSAMKIAGGVKSRGKKPALGPVTKLSSTSSDWGDLLN